VRPGSDPIFFLQSRPEMMNKIDEHNMITFKQLKALISFFDYYNNSGYYDACEVN